jgi:hypothetical protein
MKLPTDLEILEYIYKKYNDYFIQTSEEQPSKVNHVWVPIDTLEIAKHFKVHNDIIFGRLYYYLKPKYYFEEPNNGPKTTLFLHSSELHSDKHQINFSLMTSILAGMQEEDSKNKKALRNATISIVISIASTILAFFAIYLNNNFEKIVDLFSK